MSNVHILDVETRLDLPAERILQAALDAGLEQVIVIGRLKPEIEGVPAIDGQEYMASSIANGAEVLWLVERLKFRLMGIAGS